MMRARVAEMWAAENSLAFFCLGGRMDGRMGCEGVAVYIY